MTQTVDMVWEHKDIPMRVGDFYAFTMTLPGNGRTKPFGLVQRGFELGKFLNEQRVQSAQRVLFWAKIVDMKIDRRGRVYPIIEPKAAYDHEGLKRLGLEDMLENT